MARKGEKISEEHRAKLRAQMLGKNNHRFGKKASEETRQKISESNKGKHFYWKGKKQPQSMIDSRVIQLKIPCSEEKKKKISAGNKGKKRSPETIAKYRARKMTKEEKIIRSLRMSQMYMSGWNPTKTRTKGRFCSEKMKKEIPYRSSYELVAYRILENNNSVVSYFSEPLRIPYFWDGMTRMYVPDIKVIYKNGDIEIIEVKSSWQLKDERVIQKTLAAKMYCIDMGFIFSVWTERDLFNG